MNQIENINSSTSDVRFDVVGLTCRMKSVLFTAMFNIEVVQFLLLHPKGIGGGSGVTGVGAVSKLGSNEDVANIFTTAPNIFTGSPNVNFWKISVQKTI